MNLSYEELPDEIQLEVPKRYFHKAEKKGTSIICIHSTNCKKRTWRKMNGTWDRLLPGDLRKAKPEEIEELSKKYS